MAELADNVYQMHGYENRAEYLDNLRDEYGSFIVDTLITVLPEEEDFDGLVTSLEDYRDLGVYDLE
jgi:hypothetical protein